VYEFQLSGGGLYSDYATWSKLQKTAEDKKKSGWYSIEELETIKQARDKKQKDAEAEQAASKKAK